MGHPLADIITYFVISKFYNRGNKSATCCGRSRQSQSRHYDSHYCSSSSGKSGLKIDLKFGDDETLTDVQVEGGDVTRMEKDGDKTIIHVTWKL